MKNNLSNISVRVIAGTRIKSSPMDDWIDSNQGWLKGGGIPKTPPLESKILENPYS